MKRILITGVLGQIGSELLEALQNKYGEENIVGIDRKPLPENLKIKYYEIIDVCNYGSLKNVIKRYNIDTVFHLAAILSATGEKNPQHCWDVNMYGLINVLNIGVELKLEKIIVPSSIAVFGPDTPKVNTPNDTILKPSTMYGVTKVCGERLGDYYVQKFGLDVRGMRLPGIISYKTLPGGGTTDYAVEIFYEALKNKYYKCFLKEDTRLPMMYMPDCIKAFIDLAEAPFEKLKHHCDFNVTGMSFTPKEIADAIKVHIPDFKIEYKPDFRQTIAESWPQSIDDSVAREEWGWKPDYDLHKMTEDMINNLKKKLNL